jgi:hypothetical protein
MIAALIKRDRLALSIFALAGAALHLGALVDANGGRTWVLPMSVVDVQSAMLWMAGTALGLWAALGDRLLRTREYWEHRPVSQRTLLLARHLGCALVMLVAWMLLPVLVSLLVVRLFRTDASLVEPQRFWHLVASSSVALPCYAAAFFGAGLARRLGVCLVLGAAWPTVLLFIGSAFQRAVAGREASRPLLVFAMYLGLALFLLAGAHQQEMRGHDPDRPVSPRTLWLVLPLSVAGLLLLLTGTASLHLRELADSLMDVYPDVALMDGKPVLVRWDDDRRRNRQVDAEHAFLSEPAGDAIAGSLLWTSRTALADKARPPDHWHRGRAYTSIAYEPFTILDRERGRLLVTRAAVGPEEPFYRVELDKQGAPFSSKTRPLSMFGDVYFVDEADNTFWSLSAGAEQPGLVRLELPAGDRFVGIVDAPARALESDQPPTLTSMWTVAVVRGERGIYRVKKGAFVPVSPALREWLEERLAFEPTVTRTGPFRFSLLLRDRRSGAVALQHEFAPRTGLERAIAGLAIASSLTTPGLHPLVGDSAPARAVERLIVGSRRKRVLAFEPLARSSPALLVVHLGLALGLAAAAFLRLGRLGAGPGRRWGWSLAVFCGGVAVFIAYRLWETKRAWLPIKSVGVPRDPLLIAPRPQAVERLAASQ